jgi:hypothetical protein
MSALLDRLRAPAALERLAGLLVDDALARPLGELFDPPRLAEALRAIATSESAERRVAAWLARAARDLGAETRTLAQLLPAPLAAAAREIVELPLTPRRATVEKLLDHPPVRRLLRGQVLAMLVDFARRAAAPFTDNRLARGLRAFTPRAVADAVSGETERRAADFADTAVAEVLGGLAADLADPTRAREQSEVRGAVFQGALATMPAELVAPLAGNLDRAASIACRALAAWTSSPRFEEELAALARFLVAEDAARPLGDLLADLGVRELAAVRARELVAARLGAVAGGDAFARWLDELLA